TPPPPPSTLFPYTTLFRSRSPSLVRHRAVMAEANPPGLQTENGLEASFRCSLCGEEAGRVRLYAPGEAIAAGDRPGSKAVAELRSEEHTSELQSLRHLVCR